MIQFIIIIFIIFIIFFIFLSYKNNFPFRKQLAGLFPTKKCDYKNYYYLWIYMAMGKGDHKKTITNPEFKNWVRKIKLSGPNRLGIYVDDDKISKEILKNYIQLFKVAFNYDCKYILFKKKYISENIKELCRSNNLKIKKHTKNLHYCD